MTGYLVSLPMGLAVGAAYGLVQVRSPREFRQITMPDVASCLVLDIRLPGVSGLDFQAELAEADIRIPVILMTGHGDIPMSVKAMKTGAVDFLTKPFREQDILDAVIKAIERDQKRRDSEKGVSELRSRFDSLTSRERILKSTTFGVKLSEHVRREDDKMIVPRDARVASHCEHQMVPVIGRLWRPIFPMAAWSASLSGRGW
jgi:DNA-binding response OmpR family regulator